MDRINSTRVRLTEDDFNKILNAVRFGAGSISARSQQQKFKNRDMSIMLLFMTTGMRKTALDEINVDDVDLCSRKLRIIDKGNKIHTYILNNQTIDALNSWIFDRNNILNGVKCDALFISKDLRRMHGNSISKLVDKYAMEGLGYHISPHKLRAGLASIMYEKTGNIEFTRKVIGHANITTTQRYIVTKNNERAEASNIMQNILK